MKSHHILIVEDEPNTAEMLETYFSSQGYLVSTVDEGKKALTFVQEVLPDVILLDIRLPDIDGYEVCRQLRGHWRTANIPIVFLTEKRDRGDRLTGLELGAVDYITKPFDVQELRLRVRNILRRSDERPVAHPVTGLPYASAVDEHLHRLMKQPRWAVVAVGMDGLEPFADMYGFVARDDVLRAVALIIRRTVQEEIGEETFVGQLDDTSFVLITAPEHAQRLQDVLRARLQEAVAFFYPRADWDAGKRENGSPLPQLSIHFGLLTGPTTAQDVEALRQLIKASLPPA
ncbi:MAG TPA: response regulator [Thermoflexia bacterium]|jgi:PleD family two-component response regulator|nr:response regulator [Thermoflexia bacterium]